MHAELQVWCSSEDIWCKDILRAAVLARRMKMFDLQEIQELLRNNVISIQNLLDVVLQFLSSLLQWFGSQVLVSLTGEIRSSQNLLQLPVKRLKFTVSPQNKVFPSIEQNLQPEEFAQLSRLVLFPHERRNKDLDDWRHTLMTQHLQDH